MPTNLIKVSSSHQVNDVNNHSKFVVNFGQSEAGHHQITSLQLVSAVIPNTMYNVNEYNNVLRYDRNGAGVTSLQVAPGQYTTSDLITILQTAIAGLTITQDANTGLLNFASTVTLDILSDKDDPLSTFATPLGVIDTLNILAVGNADALKIPSFFGLTGVMVNSNITVSNLYSTSADNVPRTLNTIAVLPMTVSFGRMQPFSIEDSELTKVFFEGTTNLSRLEITLTDLDNNELILSGGEVHLVFRVHY